MRVVLNLGGVFISALHLFALEPGSRIARRYERGLMFHVSTKASRQYTLTVRKLLDGTTLVHSHTQLMHVGLRRVSAAAWEVCSA